jgi:predicted AAA+ superfamily ATPase
MMWIARRIENLLRTRAATRPVVVLTGARQTGKTSLVQRLFPAYEYVSLDLPSEAAQAEHEPDGFLARHRPPLIVDEVQYAPSLFRHVKTVVDRRRSENGLFILTGSQKLTLMKSVSESLAGRADVLELETLSWAEAHAAIPSLTLERFIIRGGFPELHQKPELDSDGFHRSYVATYLERDLRQSLQVTSLRDFERFIRACALRTGQMLNRADLARYVGISGSTTAAWLNVLVASGQVALLEPWFSNRTKSLVKSPKLYLCDSGLCAFLSGVRSSEDLLDSPQAGALWETLVFGELRRLQIDRRGGWDLHFWRDRAKEVDFLIHRGGRFELAEAKWTELPTDRDSAALRRLIEELGEKAVTRAAIVCRCRNQFPLPGSIQAIPLEAIQQSWA